jgi:RNase P subunit RPR2
VADYKCKCGETDPNKFYGHKKSICGRCHNIYTLKIGQEKKDKARAFLGGKCKKCGFDEYKWSLDIHHLDPSKKDEYYSSMRSWSWSRIEREIKGCILLCKNCHAALHAGAFDVNGD